jgi:hypothetical protein
LKALPQPLTCEAFTPAMPLLARALEMAPVEEAEQAIWLAETPVGTVTV